MNKYCSTKRYDCSDCTINKNHKMDYCEPLLFAYKQGREEEKLEQSDKINEVLIELENQRNRFNKLGLKAEVIGCVSAIEIIRNAFNQIVKEV